MKTGDWQGIHERLVRLARAQAAHDYEIGRWLLAALRARVDEELGYGSLLEYGERLFGYQRRMVAERLRVARALEELPALAESLRNATLSWSAVRELSRVATGETEDAWIEAARARTVREVEAMVSGREPGARPGDPAQPRAERHVLRFEVNGETLALMREAQAQLTRDAGGHLNDDELMALMARLVLGGPPDTGRAGYQVAVSVCPTCEQATQQAGGDEVPIDEVAAEVAACDAQVIDLTGAHVGAGRATQSIPPATRRLVMRRDGGRCVVPGCRHAIVDCHHLRRRADGGTHDPDNLIAICGAHHARIHKGLLVVEGSPSAGLRFYHADGTAYGGAPEPGAVQAFADAFQALATLGFGEREARRAVEAARAHVGATPGVEEVLREALASLRQAA
jgi:hypothetical protein